MPTRLLRGTRQSSKISSEISAPRMPIFSSRLPTVKPGVPRSTTMADMPLTPFSGSVRAMTTT